MKNIEEFKTPGQLIAALLEEKGWTKRTLAILLNMQESAISRYVSDKRDVDAEFAISLEEILGHPADDFTQLQNDFNMASARIKARRPDQERAILTQLYSGLPVAQMISRGWIHVDEQKNPYEIGNALTKFFKASSVSEIEALPHAAKKTATTAEVTPIQLAWLYRVKELANGLLAPKYTDSAGKNAIKQLSLLLSAPEEARNAPRILREAGIRFLLVETLPSSKIDGVCFWLDDDSPVIALSMRFDRIDNFWFVLRHELEHVLCRHGQKAAIVDVDVGDDAAAHSEEEKIANKAAANFCVPQKSMDSFIARKAPLFAKRDLLGMARTIGIHPGLIVGQLQKRTGRYELFRDQLVKIRAHVAPSAIVDGWGDIAQVLI